MMVDDMDNGYSAAAADDVDDNDDAEIDANSAL